MSGTTSPRRRWAFTLIELLTVVAIISLLISILVPSLSGARDAAKNAKTRSIMKAAGEGLELFRNENEQELRGNNYPPSTPGDDPTESGNNNSPGNEELCGAQWLVRYLLGKDLNGYVARRNVPVGAIGTTPGF
ncbi:MAG TPA: type II secretion system protein, partial [Phycisphaerae bacterium]|nr:type II secretion system protein [Phycisphaerae bacterium]